MRRLKIGAIGLGRAFTLMAPGFVRDPRVELAAAADPRPEARARFSADFGGKTFNSFEELCDERTLDVVYIATPHQLHAQQAAYAAATGKHLLVEKPMALTLAECRTMIEAAREHRVQLIVGHSHSFDRPILKAREIIASGAVGKLGMITAINFTDFLYRPRRPEELATERGGGAVYNQAAHHIDMVRLLAGGRAKSVRAATGRWDASRPTEGAYSALLAFENGAFATLAYSGYAHFDSDELCGWIGEMGQKKDPAAYGATRRLLVQAEDELALKGARNYGGQDFKALPAENLHQHFGFLIASCERADLKPMPDGVVVYGDSERRFEPLPAPQVPRVEVIDELYEAVVHGKAPLHSGEWALATTEVCLAMLDSAREEKEVALGHQIAATAA